MSGKKGKELSFYPDGEGPWTQYKDAKVRRRNGEDVEEVKKPKKKTFKELIAEDKANAEAEYAEPIAKSALSQGVTVNKDKKSGGNVTVTHTVNNYPGATWAYPAPVAVVVPHPVVPVVPVTTVFHPGLVAPVASYGYPTVVGCGGTVVYPVLAGCGGDKKKEEKDSKDAVKEKKKPKAEKAKKEEAKEIAKELADPAKETKEAKKTKKKEAKAAGDQAEHQEAETKKKIAKV